CALPIFIAHRCLEKMTVEFAFWIIPPCCTKLTSHTHIHTHTHTHTHTPTHSHTHTHTSARHFSVPSDSPDGPKVAGCQKPPGTTDTNITHIHRHTHAHTPHTPHITTQKGDTTETGAVRPS